MKSYRKYGLFYLIYVVNIRLHIKEGAFPYMKKSFLLLFPLAASLILASCGPTASSSESSQSASGKSDTATSQSASMSTSKSDSASASQSSSDEPIAKNTIAAITKSGDYDVKAVIAAVTNKGFVLDDGTGAIYVYKALDAAFAVGDYVSTKLTVAPRYAIWEATEAASMAKVEGTAPTIAAPTALTKAIIDDWVSKAGSNTETEAPLATKDVRQVSFAATAALDGTFTYFTIEGSTTKLEPSGLLPSIEIITGVKYEVVAYCGGYNSSKSYVSIYVKSATPKYDKITGLTVSGAASVEVGASTQLTATADPVGADPHVIWSSKDATIATVDEKGVVKGVKEGATKIVATSVADSAIAKEYDVTVTKAIPTSSLVKYDLSKIASAPSTSPYGALDAAGVLAILKDATYTVSGTNPITAVSAATNVYQANNSQGPKATGLKIGAKASKGVLTLTSSKNIAEVKLTVRAWSASKLASIAVNTETAVALVAADVSTARSLDFKLATAGTTITISSSIYSVFTSLELIGA
jgi:hypothetical protein